jgi:hypothetical protein
MNMSVEQAIGALAQREQIVNMVVDNVTESESTYSGIRAMYPRLYDLWRGTWTARNSPHRNSVHIPLIFSALWADSARKASTSLNDPRPVSFMGYGPDDEPTARKRESLFAAQSKDDKLYLKQVDNFLMGSLYGNSVTQVGWKRTEEMRIIEAVDRMPLSGQIVRQIRKGKIITFDGPESQNVDMLDFFPCPGFRTIDEMPWVVRRYFLDLDDLRYMAEAGIFSKSEVDRLIHEGGVNSGPASLGASARRFQSRVGVDDDSTRYMSKWRRPVEILEMWGIVPSELCSDGVFKRVITVANRRYLLRNKPNPFWHGLKPFLNYSPMPDPHYFYAPGKAEIVAKLQIVANRYVNQSLDAADLMIDPMWFYDRGAGLSTRNLYSRPGRYIPVNGNPNQVVSALQPNLNGLTVADQKVGQMREAVQMGTGIVDDAVAGLGGDSRQTAREFQGRREAAGTRLLLESRLYEETMLEPLANMFIALDRQFLELPVEVLILGEGAMVDPVTRMPIPSSREVLEGYDMVKNYSARALGSTMALSKGTKQEHLLQLLNAMASPLGQSALGQINAVNFFRGIFREFEIPNINEVFAANPALQPLVQGAGGQPQMGAQGVPTSGQLIQGQGIPSLPGEGSAQSLQMPVNIGQQRLSPMAA